MIYISHLKINYSTVINYHQILVADNNNSVSLLTLLVHHRLAVALFHMASVQDPDDGAAPLWAVTGLMEEGERMGESHDSF